MFPQAVLFPQTYPGDDTTNFYDLATDCLMPTGIYDDHVLMGDYTVYNPFACEANATFGQCFPNFPGYTLFSEETYHAMNYLSSASHAIEYATSSSTANDPPFPLFPSPPPSQASSSPEYQQAPPEPAPVPGLGCREATPVFNHIRKKWSCGVCNKDFRGKWECRRHIEATGKRARCLACGVTLKGRGDSLLRHFKKYCKGDVGNLEFKNAFIEA